MEKAHEKAETARKAHRKAPTDKTQEAVKSAEAAVPEAEAEEQRIGMQVRGENEVRVCVCVCEERGGCCALD